MGPEERPETREGMLDPQLSFAGFGPAVSQPVERIVKRGGREEAFDKAKIAEAIFLAAQEDGDADRDRALSLANGVAIYLGKRVHGRTATAGDVAEAVERVLVEMGHARTAMAYRRHRERRERLRQLRARDARAVVKGLADSERERTGAGVPPSLLFVRTSGEQIDRWSPDRIVSALVRETGLDEATATSIAGEVENQVRNAGMTTLTSALIRELVNARLIERGLEDRWRRHARLGVPLYDAERIISGVAAEGHATNPAATGRILAESVKREFALAHVFSGATAESHLMGDLHVHDLESVDRLTGAVLPLGSLARYGLGVPGTASYGAPATRLDQFLSQMVFASGLLGNHFTQPIEWDAVNTFVAPFLMGHGEGAPEEAARMAAYEFATRSALGHPAARLVFSYEIPARLAGIVVAGSDRPDHTYGRFEHLSQRFARSFFDVLEQGGAGGAALAGPEVVLRFTPDFFRAPGHEDFLERVCRVALHRGNMRFRFDRDAWLTEGIEPWDTRDIAAHRVTLNLPRLAARATDEAQFARDLAHLIEAAARAHDEKRVFVERLVTMDAVGPWSALVVRHDGRRWFDTRHARYITGVTGLNECAQVFAGAQLGETSEASEFAAWVLELVAEQCRIWSDMMDLRIEPGQTSDLNVARRFASFDADLYPDSVKPLLKSDSQRYDLFYTPGYQVPFGSDCSPYDRVEIEGRFHTAAPFAAITELHLRDPETSPRTLADFVRKTWHHTECREFVLAR